MGHNVAKATDNICCAKGEGVVPILVYVPPKGVVDHRAVASLRNLAQVARTATIR